MGHGRTKPVKKLASDLVMARKKVDQDIKTVDLELEHVQLMGTGQWVVNGSLLK
jgi:hypothetical protein